MSLTSAPTARISIHALREEGDACRGVCRRVRPISIHALREEGDSVLFGRLSGAAGISIHALREEGDVKAAAVKAYAAIFLSTPSARRATYAPSRRCLCDAFLSTPSARRATRSFELSVKLSDISIHALREEGDGALEGVYGREQDFYPRPPRGGRPVASRLFESQQKFLSTPSARRATSNFGNYWKGKLISIHALREEGDYFRAIAFIAQNDFYPRPPRGGRHESLQDG